MLCHAYHCRDSSPGTLSDLRSASVNNTRLASVAVLHKMHTFIRHCSSPLFHDIGLFVEQLQQAVADQEKNIIEQQKVLRQQQRLAAARAAAEGKHAAVTHGRVNGKQKAGEEDLNNMLAKRQRSSSPDSQSMHRSSSSPGITPEASPERPMFAQAPAPACNSTELPQPVPTQPISALEPDQTCEKASAAENQSAPSISTLQVSKQPEDGTTAVAEIEAAAEAAAEGDVAAAVAMDLENGVAHPLGGPKLDRPKSKRKKYIYNKEPAKVCVAGNKCDSFLLLGITSIPLVDLIDSSY